MVSDLASGIFYSGYSLGTFLGPVGGGFLNQFYESSDSVAHYCIQESMDKIEACKNERAFELTSYYMTLLSGIVLILYVVVGEAYKAWLGICRCCAAKSQQEN